MQAGPAEQALWPGPGQAPAARPLLGARGEAGTAEPGVSRGAHARWNVGQGLCKLRSPAQGRSPHLIFPDASQPGGPACQSDPNEGQAWVQILESQLRHLQSQVTLGNRL